MAWHPPESHAVPANCVNELGCPFLSPKILAFRLAPTLSLFHTMHPSISYCFSAYGAMATECSLQFILFRSFCYQSAQNSQIDLQSMYQNAVGLNLQPYRTYPWCFFHD